MIVLNVYHRPAIPADCVKVHTLPPRDYLPRHHPLDSAGRNAVFIFFPYCFNRVRCVLVPPARISERYRIIFTFPLRQFPAFVTITAAPPYFNKSATRLASTLHCNRFSQSGCLSPFEISPGFLQLIRKSRFVDHSPVLQVRCFPCNSNLPFFSPCASLVPALTF